MIEITKRKVSGDFSNGSCNYCNRAKLKTVGFGLEYPYEYVLIIKGDAISTRICEECFEKLTSINFKDVKEVDNDLVKNEIVL